MDFNDADFRIKFFRILMDASMVLGRDYIEKWNEDVTSDNVNDKLIEMLNDVDKYYERILNNTKTDLNLQQMLQSDITKYPIIQKPWV